MATIDALPGHSINEWARDVLRGLGVPVSQSNLDTLTKWATLESSGYNPSLPGGRFNPLNTTETAAGGVCGQGGSQGNIVDFCTYEDGIRGIVWNLKNAGSQSSGQDNFGYGKIVAALARSDQPAAFAAIQASSFCPGCPHYANLGGVRVGDGDAIGTGSIPAGVAAGTGTGAANDETVNAADDECLFALPGVDLKVVTLGGNCLIKRSQGRALLGAASMLAGAGILLVGLVLIGVSTKPGRTLAGIAGVPT